MKNIAVIAGGDSGEYKISINSATVVAQNIDAKKNHIYLVEIKGSDWFHQHPSLGRIDIDKNDFSLTIENETIRFDKIFNAIHGTPGEDGKILGYFEMLGIPFTSSSAIASGLTFNKSYCNQVVKNAGVLVANSVHLFKGESFHIEEILNKISLPCFVKPNQGGSSVGMSKVKEVQELQAAIEKAFA
ncbi:MAG: D-alanine--D-alanine ligase, partial [Bacteroidales bacterium]|nr:D-alanine--D-alanine ligase [Bacteroidales bacterium]